MQLEYLERLPKTPASAAGAPLIVLLHGRAAWAKTIFTIEGLLDPRFHVVAFQGPLLSEKGGFEWFRPEETLPEAERATRFVHAEDLLTSDIAEYCGRHPIDRSRVFLWGFSQGAAMSLVLGLRGQVAPAGAVPMSGFLPSQVKAWDTFDTRSKYLLVHGTSDEVLPPASSLSALKFLMQHGIRAEYHEYRGRHKMSLDSIAYINNWLRKEAGLE